MVKKLVLAVLMLAATTGVVAAAVACHRHWRWLEDHHLAGLAALQILFLAASVVFAGVNVRQEWSKHSPSHVARGYVLGFGLMATALLAVGVGLLALGWLWTLGAAGLRLMVTRYPLALFGGIAVVYLAVSRWNRLSPGARRYLGERLLRRRSGSEKVTE